jgi:hypothetical protein
MAGYLHTYSHTAGFVGGPALLGLLGEVRRLLFLAANILVMRRCLVISDPDDDNTCGLRNPGVFGASDAAVSLKQLWPLSMLGRILLS